MTEDATFDDLFQGTVIVIDDEVGENESIDAIVKQIEEKKIPFITYKELPDEESIIHFQGLSFLILDWNLNNFGLSGASALEEENIEFIKKLNEQCFCPIFLFTNESTTYVEEKLENGGVITKGKPSNVFVKRKSDVGTWKELKDTVNEWLSENPSVYALKKWDKEYQSGRAKLFCDFQAIDPLWPKILWDSFVNDRSDPSLELANVISRNLNSRMMPVSQMIPVKFQNTDQKETKQVPRKDQEETRQVPYTDQKETKQVIEGAMYLKKESLHDTNIGTGDLFRFCNHGGKKPYLLNIREQCDLMEKNDCNKEEKTYLLNIRAQCDLMAKNEKDKKKIDLYCLRGKILTEKEIAELYDEGHGNFKEKVNEAIIAFVDGGEVLKFCFRDLKIKKWKCLKEHRIGRLLPPHTTRIQQKHALYLQREGLPRIPKEVFPEEVLQSLGTKKDS
jgi:hypothetical protein